ncbi:MAG: DNA polymerase I [Thermodesulfovibrio sp.]|nr:DNA polymerase I [Thermodesulfovibrio sp.]
MREIYLVDGSCFIYRAYHAIKGLSTSQGIPTNAIYGFTRMLIKLLKKRKIHYIIIAFDSPHPTKRHKVYEQYKITRPETPKDLPIQIEYIKKIVNALGIKKVEIPGYEADDIIATVVDKLTKNFTHSLFKQSPNEDLKIFIVTLDKDVLQLISDRVFVYDPFTETVFDIKKVRQRYGVNPERFVDYMALVGDSIDNIPGVKGVGEKLAKELLEKYGSVENIIKSLPYLKPERVAKLIKEDMNSLKLSKELVLLRKDAPFDFSLEDLKVRNTDKAQLIQIFRELEFRSLLKEISPNEAKVEQYEKFEGNRADKVALIFLEEKALIGINNKNYESFYNNSLIELLNSDSLKILYDAKEDIKKLRKKGLEIREPYFDLMVAAYLLNPDKGKYSLEDLTIEYFGKIKPRVPQTYIELYEIIYNLLKEKEIEKVYFKIEMPLIKVLAHMEEAGIKVNLSKLFELEKLLSFEIEKIKEKIYKLAGLTFNINSPKQLAEVLYDKIGLKSKKRGKKSRSTEMEVLEELSNQHDIVREIINYRILNKVFTGYLLPLKDYINPETQRVHAKWHQTVAGTGRVISIEPNLQNIPIKGYWAELLREVFSTKEGYVFLSADYSQIELRILAHLSKDPTLIRAFKANEDIHSFTASQIFSVPVESVTEEQRRVAKTVNFGVIYGMSAFGLSEAIKIPLEAAQEFIDMYFLRYPMVKKFIEETLDFARKNSYVKTLYGRIRPIVNIDSPNQNIRIQAERVAINTVVQGSAADIIKIAMIRIYNEIKKENLDAEIILQIHDEIVLEVREEILDKVKKIVTEKMQNFDLSVPLKINISYGKTLNL